MRTNAFLLNFIILTISSSLHAQQGGLGNLLYNLHQNRTDLSQLESALSQLKKDAEIAYQLDSFSVVFNPPVPPSANKHDYYSFPPYVWPNENTADGLPYVHKDGQTNPESEKLSDKIILRQMATAVHHLSLAYYFLEEEKYAQKAISLLQTWFIDPTTKMEPHLNFAQCIPGKKIGSPYGIIDSRWFVLVVDALKILEATGKLEQATENSLKDWFKAYLNWLLESELGQLDARMENNHGSWYFAQVATYADYLGEKPLLKFVLNESKQFFDSQIDSLGQQVFELHRTKSFDYSLYNIHALITLAKLAEQQQIDLWSYVGSKNQSIYKSIKFLAEFYLEDKTWPYEQIAEKAIQLPYKDGLKFSVYYPYDLYSAVLIGHKVYNDPVITACLKKIQQQGGKQHFLNLKIHLH